MTTTPTERRLAITPGEATIRHDYNVFAGDRLVCNAGGHQNNHDNGKGDAENRANATLYADAHNTYNACGLTPSELLAKVREADEHIRLLICEAMEWRDHCDGQVESFDGAEREMMMNCASIARQRIDKARAFLSTLNLPQ